jgi:hypothetical protein
MKIKIFTMGKKSLTRFLVIPFQYPQGHKLNRGLEKK